MCAFVQVLSVDVSQSTKLPLSAVTPVPDAAERGNALKVRVITNWNWTIVDTCCRALIYVCVRVCVCVCMDVHVCAYVCICVFERLNVRAGK